MPAFLWCAGLIVPPSFLPVITDSHRFIEAWTQRLLRKSSPAERCTHNQVSMESPRGRRGSGGSELILTSELCAVPPGTALRAKRSQRELRLNLDLNIGRPPPNLCPAPFQQPADQLRERD